MGTEYIREVRVLPDGVYLDSKSNNDDLPYRIWRCDSLSEIYHQEGRLGLDREIIKMFCEYASPKGSHSSLRRYLYALQSERHRVLRSEYLEVSGSAFSELNDHDKETMYFNPTEAAKRFMETVKELQHQYYTNLAKLCSEYGRKTKGNKNGRFNKEGA